jgi:hypothetical protein
MQQVQHVGERILRKKAEREIRKRLIFAFLSLSQDGS